jgi:hypothetical protein
MKASKSIAEKSVGVKFLKARDLSERWGLSLAATYKTFGRQIPVIKIGGAVRVPIAAVETFEQEQLFRGCE